MKTIWIYLGCVLSMMSFAVTASPNFSYVSLGYSQEKVSRQSNDCTQDGLLLNVSVPLNEWYYAIAEHSDQTSSKWCGATKTRAGAGMHYDVGAYSAVYGELSALIANFPWDEGIGVATSVGIRVIAVHGTEVKGFVTYESVEDHEVGLFGVGVNMWMNREFSGFFDLAVGSDSEQRLQLGVRYNF